MTRSAANRRQAEIAFHLATAWRRAAKMQRAEEGFRRAVELDPSYLPPYIDLAQILEIGHRFDEAAALFEVAERLNPLDGGLRSRRARLEARLSPLPVTAVDDSRPAAARVKAPHVLVYTDTSGIYGAEQINHALILGLSAAGFRVTSAHPSVNQSLVQERSRAGIDHVWLLDDYEFDGENPPRKLADPDEPRRVLETTAPDLVLFNDGSPMASVGPKYAAYAAGIPFLVLIHCVDRSWADTWADYLPSLASAYRAAEDVIAVSSENLELLRGFFRLPDDKGLVILNGRPPVFFEPRNDRARASLRRDLQIPEDATALLTVARLDGVKGHQHILDAITRMSGEPALANLYLLWAGSGGLDSLLRARVSSMGLADRVRFLGERSDVPALLDAADAFVLPSHFEGMPLSVMEAMAKGLPVAASAVSGTPEELGDAGVLLPNPAVDTPGTVAALVGVIRLWSANPVERARVGEACRNRASQLFREERMVDDYRRLISAVLGRRTGQIDRVAP
jgi:glycosyltransferase involved in cell wall biosynthesis